MCWSDKIETIQTLSGWRHYTYVMRARSPIYRHEHSPELKGVLVPFARRYASLDGHRFREKWSEFVTDHADVLDRESSRLAGEGYAGGSCVDKAYCSARYYYRTRGGEDERSYPSRRRSPVPFSDEMLECLEAHVACSDPAVAPRLLYLDFIRLNAALAVEEVERLVETGTVLTAEAAEQRLRRAYKSRCWRRRRGS
jgi:hypothetical protein